MQFHRTSPNLYFAIFALAVAAVWLAAGTAPVRSQSARSQSAPSELELERAKACQNAEAERDKLDTRELRDLLGKKPQEEAANLDRKRLDNLRRLIELDAQVMFECRLMAHPDLNGKTASEAREIRPKKQALSAVAAELPMQKPKVAAAQPKQANLLPLPVRKPK